MRIYLISILLHLCVLAIGAQDRRTTVLNSMDIRTDKHKWIVLSVELKDGCTIVEKYVSPRDDEPTWIASDRSEYIEDAVTGKKYYITGSEIGFESEKVVLHGEARIFRETYPCLPDDVRYLNISSGYRYYVRSVDLTKERYPDRPPVSDVSFFGIPLGIDGDTAVRMLKDKGFKPFYKEVKEIIIGEEMVETYLHGVVDDYPVIIELEVNRMHDVVVNAEVMYQNHIDLYEVNEHLQELSGEVKVKYPYRYFKDLTPDYMNAAGIIVMKSGKDSIFKSVTVVEFRGYYYILESPDEAEDDFIGAVSFEVHDNMRQDHVICVRYSDVGLSRYIRRSRGEYRW